MSVTEILHSVHYLMINMKIWSRSTLIQLGSVVISSIYLLLYLLKVMFFHGYHVFSAYVTSCNHIYAPRDDSQGALRFAPVCPSVRHALRYRVCVIAVLMGLFETLHTCCRHNEDVHVGFWWS